MNYAHFEADLHGTIVPQAVCTPSGSAPYPKFDNIMFKEVHRFGINLQAALNGYSHLIPDGDTRPTTTTTSTKIKIRIQWPGYPEFWKDINAKEHTRAGDPIPKWKLALCVAQVVASFYSKFMCSGYIGDWAVERIPFQSLKLLELRQVSTGSWQPVLVYEH
ncbi:hypothetical protein BDY19DRAFT_991030 [Irpex rosettiformis]|uniref:Uncharacterized protein n=1 Tax=Irpex rosettiformis TaxID=378272 RepID=A0ACB8UDK2_9APHY|nr:hypothetical protein BDY19DRAFT_991030 [Irpex rosettiformis]